MGVAAHGGLLFVSDSRGQTHAVYNGFHDIRKQFAAAFGTNLTGWGDSWVDLQNSGRPDLVLANGAIPVTNLATDAAPLQVISKRGGRWVNASVLTGLAVNGRGLAAADYDNDGRVDLAVGVVGGKLLLLHNRSTSGHWLTIDVRPFSPGAEVTAFESHGHAQTREIQAGSSYLSSEDPRAHFGFGSAKPTRVRVTYPDGTVKTVRPGADRIVTVRR